MINFEEGKQYVIIASEKMKRYGTNKVIMPEKTVDADGNAAYKYDGNIIDPHITIAVELDSPLTINGEFICENFLADCDVKFDSGYLTAISGIYCGSNTISAEKIRGFSICAKTISSEKLDAGIVRAKDVNAGSISAEELYANEFIFSIRAKVASLHVTSIKEGNGYMFPKIFSVGIFANELTAPSTQVFASQVEVETIDVNTVTTIDLTVEKDLQAEKVICETLTYPGKISKRTCFTGKQVK